MKLASVRDPLVSIDCIRTTHSGHDFSRGCITGYVDSYFRVQSTSSSQHQHQILLNNIEIQTVYILLCPYRGITSSRAKFKRLKIFDTIPIMTQQGSFVRGHSKENNDEGFYFQHVFGTLETIFK